MPTKKLTPVAQAILALALSACQPTMGLAPIPPGTPAPVGPTAGPTAPAKTPEPPTGLDPVGGGGPSPTASAPMNRSRLVIVAGMVYDEAGAALDGAEVRIRSLESSVPYEASARAASGSWVVNNVPEGVNVEVRVSKPGHTTRRQVAAFQANAAVRNTIDFGAPSGGSADAPGAAHFLSSYPEIEATEPVTRATDQDATSLTYSLTLSEPLDAANRKRLEDALRVFPADADASPNGVAGDHADLEGVADAPAINVDTAYHYVIKKGSVFLEDSATAATVAWDQEGRKATLTFKAPMIAGRSGEAKYQVGLVRGPGAASDAIIKDAEGKQLGTDEAGSLEGWPANAGELVRNAFKEPQVSLDGAAATASARWAATHDSTTTFKMRRDDVAPKLLGVAARAVGNDTRLELTFSEPMAAHDGTAAGYAHAALGDLSKYTFAIAETAARLADVTLDGKTDGQSPVADPAADATFGDLDGDREREFKLTGADADGDRADIGDVYVRPDPRDAKRVWIVLVGRKNWLDARMGAIKARVAGIGDPAGNLITESAADKGVVSGTL